MKYLIIHNRYSRRGGEESIVELQVALLRGAGHEVYLYERDYNEMKTWRFGRLSALFSALYNRKSVEQIEQIIDQYEPDAAIIHNLFPVISPAILPVLKKHGVKILMSIHNFRLICPNGLFFTNGEICEKCGSKWREINCIRSKCEGSTAGSLAFALRNFWARTRQYYLKNVDLFLVQSDFHLQKLVQYGVPAEKMRILHNCLNISVIPIAKRVDNSGVVGFVGRLSVEKGVDLFFEVARLLPDVRFRVAGECAAGFSLSSVPMNVEFTGFLDKQGLAEFYSSTDVLLATSLVYEGGITLTVLEAMFYGCVVVGQDVGAMRQTLGGGEYGLVVDYCSARQMADQTRRLLCNDLLRGKIRERAYERIIEEYGEGRYLETLVYNSL